MTTNNHPAHGPVSLFTTPPAPGAHDRYIFEKWWESQNGTPLDGWDSLRTTDGYCDDGIDGQFDAWNACRAAMLQGAEPVSEHDELPLSYLQGHKDGLEWAAQMAEANHPQTGDWLYDDPIELAMAIRKGPDMPTAQAGNSPVAQDGWVMVPKEMTDAIGEAIAMQANCCGGIALDIYDAMLAAAPQQEDL